MIPRSTAATAKTATSTPATLVCFVEDIQGEGAQAQYERVIDEVGLRDHPPDGMIMHVAGPTANGWRIIALWESHEALVSFRDDRLLPALRQIGPQACSTSAEITPVRVQIAPTTSDLRVSAR